MNYKSVGTFRFKNDTKDSVAHVQYTQQETEEVDWNVTSNIEGEAEVSAGFLGKVKAKAGVSVGRNKKWSKGRSYGTTYDVNPGNTIYLTNYQVGYNANGSIKWKRYSHGGTFLGYYSESAGGTVLSKSDLNIELTD
ncbi:hypothetical protein WG909_12895 [Peptostreptococcaceae bacterium AGR-M142]